MSKSRYFSIYLLKEGYDATNALKDGHVLDRDSKILKSLPGKVKTKYQHLIKHATGASNLRISSPVPADQLAPLCTQLLELYKDETYRTTFPDIQNITPVKDPDI